MAGNINPDELRKAVYRLFEDARAGSREAQRILELVRAGKATYADITPYSEMVGKFMSGALRETITDDLVIDGFLDGAVASGVVAPAINRAYDTSSSAAADVQKSINQSAGINFKPVPAQIDQSRVRNLVEKLTGEEFEKTKWLLNEDVIGNIARSAVTDLIQQNARLHKDAGMHAYLARYSKSHCCEWCDSVSGVFEYGEQPDGFWQVHKHCNCIIEYKPSHYGKADVISYVTGEDGKMRKVTQEGVDSEGGNDTIRLPGYKNAVISREKFTGYALDPEKDPDKARAFSDALGYIKENADDLIQQIYKQLPDCKAVEKGDKGYGMTYQVDMKIKGPNGKTAKVLTAWIKDKNGATRLITAHIDK